MCITAGWCPCRCRRRCRNRRPEPGELPGLRQLGFDAATLQRCAADGHAAGAHLRGGEHEALLRLQSFVQRVGGAAAAAAAAAANTRTTNGGKSGTATAAAAPTFCCKISPWLALGCLSPRELYAQLQRGGAEHAAAAAATTTTRPLAVTGAGGDAGALLTTDCCVTCCVKAASESVVVLPLRSSPHNVVYTLACLLVAAMQCIGPICCLLPIHAGDSPLP